MSENRTMAQKAYEDSAKGDVAAVLAVNTAHLQEVLAAEDARSAAAAGWTMVGS